MRISWDYAGPFKSIERAQDVLDDMWAFDNVGPLEEPEIEARKRRIHGKNSTVYYITLLA